MIVRDPVLVPVLSPGEDHTLVPMATLDVRPHVDAWLAEHGDDPENACGLRGGLLLRSEGTTLVEPGCCSCLDDVRDWRGAAAHRGAEWQMLWVGHPWVSVRFEEALLVVSRPHESDPPVEHFRVAPADLLRAIERATPAIEELAHRIAEALTGLPEDRATQLARRLAGLAIGS